MISSRNIEPVGWLAIFIILLGLILRFYGFADWSLTNDELSTLFRSKHNSFTEVIEKGVATDVHPAFVEVFVYYWGNTFGHSVFAHRIPFVLFSFGALIYFYLFAKSFLNRNAAILALSVFTISQLFIQYAQVARAYSVGLFFLLACSYYWCSILNKKAGIKTKIAFMVFGALCFYTHYFAGLGILILLAVGLFYISKKQVLYYIGLSAGIAVLFLPHLTLTLNHLKRGGVGWLAEPKPDFILEFLNFVFNNSMLLPAILLVCIALLFFSKSLKWNNKVFPLFLLFTLPYLIGYLYSIYRSPVLQFSVLIFFTPFLILLTGVFVKKQASFKIISLSSLLIISAGAYSLIIQRDFYNKKAFANFKGVAELSVELTKKFGKENVLSIANVVSENFINYYLNPIDSNFTFDVPIFDKPEVINETRKLIENSKREYVLVAFANVPVPLEVHEYTKQKYPEVVFQERFFNSEVIVYKKSDVKRKKTFTTNYSSYSTNKKWNVNKKFIQRDTFFSDSSSFNLLNKTQYALTYVDSFENILPENKNFFTVSARIKSEEAVKLKLVTTITRNDSTVYWRGVDTEAFYDENNWYQFLHVFQKPEGLKPNDKVVVYFWNPFHHKAYIDDFEITTFADSDYNYYEF